MKTFIKIASIISLSGMAMAQERDPFAPYTWSAPTGVAEGKASTTKDGEIISPLMDKPLTAYTVIGVAISPTDALAVLKSRDKREYFAYIGDQVGSEGGIIEAINTEGLIINIGGKIVPLKVSNRFEKLDEQTNDKPSEKTNEKTNEKIDNEAK